LANAGLALINPIMKEQSSAWSDLLMQLDNATVRKLLSKDLTETLIRFGLIAFLVVVCVWIFDPFAELALWALILAVALYPLHQRLANRLNGRQGLSATLLVAVSLIFIGAPTVMLGESFASHVNDAYTAYQNDTITIIRPDPSVAEWPIIGDKLYSAWSAAADDLPGYLKSYRPQLKQTLGNALEMAADTVGAVLLFLGALIIAGIMMAYGGPGGQAIQRILCRLTDPIRGVRLQTLLTATIRSVATGVIGVAFIQALLVGAGLYMAGIPAAGVLSLIVFLIGIAQLPALIISLPVVAYIWWSGDASTTVNIVWTIYLIVAGMADNVLKPLLLGRGVDVPMPVILIGAMGGMVSAGIIGLFLGAVLLAVGYKVFMVWVNDDEEGTSSEPDQVESNTQPSPIRD
jgi:predicted PurR-regulated permease PerM